jgi:prepilin-type N-terminal cleavage/methylation domain-containing protein
MNKGFTLIELLLVIAIIAILSYLAVPIGMNFYRSQTVEGARSQLIESLGRARRNAVLMKADSQYGVKILSADGELTSFTLYKGEVYDSSRDETYDEVYAQAPNMTISFSGTDELVSGDINFAKLSGATEAMGTITVTHDGGESRSIIIDDFGNAYKE